MKIFQIIFFISVWSTSHATSGQASLFRVGRTTACGDNFTDRDYVAAISDAYFTNLDADIDEVCGKEIQVLDPTSGLTVLVKVVEKCRHCWFNEISLSRSAYDQLRNPSGGTVIVEWTFT